MGHLHHDHTTNNWLTLLKEEMVCHLPYALVSVFVGIIGVAWLTSMIPPQHLHHVGHQLFHGFHYAHLLFAGAGVVLSFRRYSSRILSGLIVGLSVPTIFCTLSDAFIPYFAGSMLNVDMHFHWCFIDHIGTVLPFLMAGIAGGWILSCTPRGRQFYYVIGSHISHIVISSIASVLYLVTFGFTLSWTDIHLVFLFLFIAVLIPCTLSDIVVPIFFATKRL